MASTSPSVELAELSARPLLKSKVSKTIDEPSSTVESGSVSVSNAPSNTAPKLQKAGSQKNRNLAAQAKNIFRTAIARVCLAWKRCVEVVSRDWNKSWTLETLSLIASTLTLAGLVSTLLAHQNKPLPQWPQLVTINSIISLFSLLMRACVGVILTEGISQCKWNWYRKVRKLDHIGRLDSASRGSWGSINLLYHLRPSQIYYLAVLGAAITIMSSLLGFFSQQLVQFQDCLQQDTAASVRLSRTNSYNQVGGTMQSNVPTEYAPMAAAISVGILQPVGDLTNTLSSGCSSGNCTFSDKGSASFSTLAFGHFCNNITSNIRIVNETYSTRDNWTTAYLALDYEDHNSLEWSRENGGEPVVRSWTSLTPSGLTTMYFLFRSSNRDTDWRAVNCTLFPTINTYEARITDAILKEQLVDIAYLGSIFAQFDEPPVWDSDLSNTMFTWTHAMTTNYTVQNGMKESCEGSVSPGTGLFRFMKHSDESTYINGTGHTNPSAGWKWWYFPPDCVWLLNKFSEMTISESLTATFDQQNLSMGRRDGTVGSVHLRVLFEEGNITFDSIERRIDNLATLMTSVIRTHGSPVPLETPPGSSSPVLSADGQMWVNTTCASVRWSWIAYPAVIIALSGVFLLLVAIENRDTQRERLWKSSFLAALFCEVELNKRPQGIADMKAKARTASVALEKRGSGLKLA